MIHVNPLSWVSKHVPLLVVDMEKGRYKKYVDFPKFEYRDTDGDYIRNKWKGIQGMLNKAMNHGSDHYVTSMFLLDILYPTHGRLSTLGQDAVPTAWRALQSGLEAKAIAAQSREMA